MQYDRDLNASQQRQSARIVAPLLVIGGGNMASAILHGANDAGVLHKAPIVVDPNPDRRAAHQRGVETLAEGLAELTSDEQRIGTPGAIMLAVKPQIFSNVAEAYSADNATSNQARCVLSVMAGVRSEVIASRLGAGVRVVRTMPNTPASIGMGMTAIAAGVDATEADLDLAETLLGAVGRTARIDETQMDAFTGLAGSGPAYVFRFAEAMIAAGIEQGLSESIATEASIRVLLGSATMLGRAHDDGSATAADLRVAVTSPGGTTAAGLGVFEDLGLEPMIRKAIDAARARGAELAGDAGT